jgi:2-C-methyl-D-erythritol 4-phosphate cytidylyltransferase
MIVVGGGSSSRFGSDKLMIDIAGQPLIAHTVLAVRDSVDMCVLVCRGDQMDTIEKLDLGVSIVRGGATRTDSELSGLAALGGEYGLIGVHDGARPLISRDLIERLYEEAANVGGAVPILEPEQLLVDRKYHMPVQNASTVQTPQVFNGPELLATYVRAAQRSFEGDDTVEVIQKFSNIDIAAVRGDPLNIKVTHQDDIEMIRAHFEGSAHSEPR